MNLDNKREVEFLERKIADLEHTVMQLRNTIDGIEFSVVEVGRQNEPTYTQKQRVSVSMGVQKGESEELVAGTTLEDGSSEGDIQYWNDTTKEWTVLDAPIVKSVLIFDPATTPKLKWVELETFACPT